MRALIEMPYGEVGLFLIREFAVCILNITAVTKVVVRVETR